MSKVIKLTADLMDQCRAEFDQVLEKARADFNASLSSEKCSNGKIDFTFARYVKDFGSQQRRATLQFTELAWYKMATLIHEYSSEVAWHGIACRDEDESKDNYIIKDILVYPQEVDGTNVNTDQSKYEQWLYALSDEKFNNLRMQGHSHVNMGCTPSVTDEDHQRRILSQLDGDMFYIFMIYNKSYSRNIRIYDMKKNVLFDNDDVDVNIINDGLGLENLIKEAKNVVEKKKYKLAVQNVVKSAFDSSKDSNGKSKQSKKEKSKESFEEFNASKGSGAKANSSKNSAINSIYCLDDDYDLYGYSDYDEDDSFRRYGKMAKDPFYFYDGYYNGAHMN